MTDSSIDHRSTIPRTRQKLVTVSLPMIQLEIPIERGSEFIDIGRNENKEQESPGTPDMVPDLLKSIKLPNRNTNHCRSSSEIVPDEANSASSDSDHSRTDSDNSEKNTNCNLSNEYLSSSSNMSNITINNIGNNINTESVPSESANREILLELNNNLKKAINEGRKPHWIYKINEHDEDTWC